MGLYTARNLRNRTHRGVAGLILLAFLVTYLVRPPPTFALRQAGLEENAAKQEFLNRLGISSKTIPAQAGLEETIEIQGPNGPIQWQTPAMVKMVVDRFSYKNPKPEEGAKILREELQYSRGTQPPSGFWNWRSEGLFFWMMEHISDPTLGLREEERRILWGNWIHFLQSPDVRQSAEEPEDELEVFYANPGNEKPFLEIWRYILTRLLVQRQRLTQSPTPEDPLVQENLSMVRNAISVSLLKISAGEPIFDQSPQQYMEGVWLDLAIQQPLLGEGIGVVLSTWDELVAQGFEVAYSAHSDEPVQTPQDIAEEARLRQWVTRKLLELKGALRPLGETKMSLWRDCLPILVENSRKAQVAVLDSSVLIPENSPRKEPLNGWLFQLAWIDQMADAGFLRLALTNPESYVHGIYQWIRDRKKGDDRNIPKLVSDLQGYLESKGTVPIRSYLGLPTDGEPAEVTRSLKFWDSLLELKRQHRNLSIALFPDMNEKAPFDRWMAQGGKRIILTDDIFSQRVPSDPGVFKVLHLTAVPDYGTNPESFKAFPAFKYAAHLVGQGIGWGTVVSDSLRDQHSWKDAKASVVPLRDNTALEQFVGQNPHFDIHDPARFWWWIFKMDFNRYITRLGRSFLVLTPESDEGEENEAEMPFEVEGADSGVGSPKNAPLGPTVPVTAGLEQPTGEAVERVIQSLQGNPDERFQGISTILEWVEAYPQPPSEIVSRGDHLGGLLISNTLYDDSREGAPPDNSALALFTSIDGPTASDVRDLAVKTLGLAIQRWFSFLEPAISRQEARVQRYLSWMLDQLDPSTQGARLQAYLSWMPDQLDPNRPRQGAKLFVHDLSLKDNPLLKSFAIPGIRVSDTSWMGHAVTEVVLPAFSHWGRLKDLLGELGINPDRTALQLTSSAWLDDRVKWGTALILLARGNLALWRSSDVQATDSYVPEIIGPIVGGGRGGPLDEKRTDRLIGDLAHPEELEAFFLLDWAQEQLQRQEKGEMLSPAESYAAGAYERLSGALQQLAENNQISFEQVIAFIDERIQHREPPLRDQDMEALRDLFQGGEVPVLVALNFSWRLPLDRPNVSGRYEPGAQTNAKVWAGLLALEAGKWLYPDLQKRAARELEEALRDLRRAFILPSTAAGLEEDSKKWIQGLGIWSKALEPGQLAGLEAGNPVVAQVREVPTVVRLTSISLWGGLSAEVPRTRWVMAQQGVLPDQTLAGLEELFGAVERLPRILDAQGIATLATRLREVDPQGPKALLILDSSTAEQLKGGLEEFDPGWQLPAVILGVPAGLEASTDPAAMLSFLLTLLAGKDPIPGRHMAGLEATFTPQSKRQALFLTTGT